jgi:hypothetical protein
MPYTNDAKIGADIDHLTDVNDLGSDMPAPVMEYHQYPKTDILSSGYTRARGLPTVDWDFMYLTPAQADLLAAFCTDLASDDVVIYTRTNRNADEYAYFSCKMKWDQNESIKDIRREKFSLHFIDCLEVTP